MANVTVSPGRSGPVCCGEGMRSMHPRNQKVLASGEDFVNRL
jgi:hypothetical protein